MEFVQLVDAFAEAPSDSTMDAVIEATKALITDDEIAYLANVLARSGTVRTKGDVISTDVASTGAPSSL